MTDTASTAYATSIKMGWQPAEIVNPPVTVAVITVAKILPGIGFVLCGFLCFLYQLFWMYQGQKKAKSLFRGFRPNYF